MNYLISLFFNKYKSSIIIFLVLLITGIMSYVNIPKESTPDIDLGFVNIRVDLDSVSPDDAERLIVKPIENELKQVKNVEEIIATSGDGYATIGVKFDYGVDIDQGIDEVKDAVFRARSKLPSDIREPTVKEWSMADQKPIIDIVISGEVDFRVLDLASGAIEDELEKIPEILRVSTYGTRKEEISVEITPEYMETFRINHSKLYSLFNSNNKMVATGNLDLKSGKYNFKVPGTINKLDQLLNMPIKVKSGKVVLFKDIAIVKRNYVSPTSFSRINDVRSITLSIKKRTGKNIIDTINKVKVSVEKISHQLNKNIKIDYINDQSEEIEIMLLDLENNIISSVFLVFLVVLCALSFRTSLLIGISIPGSFFLGVLALHSFGITLNMVVLFSLIMSIGMLVDGAIVVAEYAENNLNAGMSPKDAYMEASKKMSIPILSSTITTLIAFAPLLNWPSITGQFMFYIPLTLIILLSCSLFVALVFIPTIGYIYANNVKFKRPSLNINSIKIKECKYSEIKGFLKLYYVVLRKVVLNPKKTILFLLMFCTSVIFIYSKYNYGTEFFPDVDSKYTNVLVKVDGDLSIYAKDKLVKEVSKELAFFKGEYDYINSKTVSKNDGVIGDLSLNLKDWKLRRSSNNINDSIRDRLNNFNGINIKVNKQQRGPRSGTDLEIQFLSKNRKELYEAVKSTTKSLSSLSYLIEVENTIPISGFEYSINVNREKATQYGASIQSIGSYIQMITTGLKISEYSPIDLDNEIDIRVKFVKEYRTYNMFNSINIETDRGLVPLSYFIDVQLKPKTSELYKIDGYATFNISANLKGGVSLNEHKSEIERILKNVNAKYSAVIFKYKGDEEEKNESSMFLMTAFLMSVSGMFIILLWQFNSIYQCIVVLTSIILSTVGVLILFLLTQSPFGIVMGGIGMISLAGIVINNNIVLIDTYNEKIKDGVNQVDAIFQTGLERFRPVLLTTITTVLGLMPMALKLNIDLLNGLYTYNAPSSQWWFQLAYTIIGGMVFASILTLFTTPAFLMLKKERNV